jgi:hypothetical protein
MMSENCPKCGSEIGFINDAKVRYECNSWALSCDGLFHESEQCLRNQLAQRTAERDLLDGAMQDTAKDLGCECDNEEILIAIDRLKAERDRAMVTLGRYINYDNDHYYAYPWMAEHGFMSRDSEYLDACQSNLNYAIAERYLEAEGKE